MSGEQDQVFDLAILGAGHDACCIQDADAKAAGESGCGCGCSTPSKVGNFDLLGIPRL
jgi:hypothetical protein